MHNYMNPFEFVPLPVNGPREIPTIIARGTPRLEGYLAYSLKALTPLHITGKTTKKDNCFEKKSFYESYGKKVIPGSSLRGMIASFVEAFTGSDLGTFTRGDEKSKSNRPPYGKHYDENNSQKCRHVGFLMASADDPIETKNKLDKYHHRGQKKHDVVMSGTKRFRPGLDVMLWMMQPVSFLDMLIRKMRKIKKRALEGLFLKI